MVDSRQSLTLGSAVRAALTDGWKRLYHSAQARFTMWSSDAIFFLKQSSFVGILFSDPFMEYPSVRTVPSVHVILPSVKLIFGPAVGACSTDDVPCTFMVISAVQL